MDLRIYCADIGSIRKGKRNFGWACTSAAQESIEHAHGDANEIRSVVAMLQADLAERRAVALGFECPLFVPVHQDANALGSARQGEVISGENRAWTANAAACVLATGLAQVSWILAELRDTSPGLTAYLDWSAFASAGAGLFLWEAFVTGEAKRGTHGEDAVAAVEAFREALPTPMGFDAVEAERPLSLIGAALLWSGWATDLEMLSTSCLVIKPRARDAERAAAKAR